MTKEVLQGEPQPFENGEWVVRYDIETQELLRKVIELSQDAIVASQSSSAIIVEYTRNHFHNLAQVIDQLGVGGRRNSYIKIEEYLNPDPKSPIVRYVPAEILEAIVNSDSYDEFGDKAVILLDEFYRKEVGEPYENIFRLGHLIVSDFSLLKAAVLAMIQPYQEVTRTTELESVVHELLYSGLGLKELIKEKKAAKRMGGSSGESGTKPVDDGNVLEWLDGMVQVFWKQVRRFFEGP